MFIKPSHEDFDITNTDCIYELKQMIEEINPEILINSTDLIGIPICEANPKRTVEINGNAVYDLAKVCNEKNIVFVQSSTHAVFNGEKEAPYTEEDICSPINIYGLSKLIGEFHTKNAGKHYIFRFPTMYGPTNNETLGFVDKMLDRMKQGQRLRVADDRMDSPSYSLHIARKVIDLLDRQYPYGIYHVSNSGYVSYYEFIKRLGKEIGFSGKVERAKDSEFPGPAPNPLRDALSSNKIKDMPDWVAGLKEYVVKEQIKC